ncbi:hypothetical protein [Wenzhouxiangella sediminis]|uniref:hypothetical protein n=1 Tax=Wenzhouxiangella sediminis TaxID=1792836 RepID=UPI0015F29C84|nr:hypothetical protein [Wenzhouxiangella sediminis]
MSGVHITFGIDSPTLPGPDISAWRHTQDLRENRLIAPGNRAVGSFQRILD